MHSDARSAKVIVFDVGGTWFRWGVYDASHGLAQTRRVPAVNYLTHPDLTARELQSALLEFILRRVHELRDNGRHETRIVSVSVGAPVNAHDMTVLGSGPLWGPSAGAFDLHARLCEAAPELDWTVLNDVTALLAPYMDRAAGRKTMLITVSSGIGSRLYDHQLQRIPCDSQHGIQGEIGHLVSTFELDGKLIRRQCECGGWNHLNAFSSGRAIARILWSLPALSPGYRDMFADSVELWQQADDEYRLAAFQAQLAHGSEPAIELLNALVTPLTRILAAALSLDPDIDRIVITGGVAHGLGMHYRDALQRTFARDGLYQITARDPDYLTKRLHWEDADDFSGLRGAGVYATRVTGTDTAGVPARRGN